MQKKTPSHFDEIFSMFLYVIAYNMKMV